VRIRYFTALLFVVFIISLTGEPQRERGLSVHMLPDRVAQINGRSGGFTVRGVNEIESTYPDARQLVAFFQTLSAPAQENGIWVVTTNPSAYSEIERVKLKTLIELCGEKKIPIFTCRGSELPNGWKRSNVPTGWNDFPPTH